MIRGSLAICAVVVLSASAPALAADMETGVWRGTLTVENARARDVRIETKAALHISPDGNQLYLENVNTALQVVELAQARDGTFALSAAAGALSVSLRNIRLSRSGFEAVAIYEPEAGAPLSGQAEFDRVKPLSPPSIRTDCAKAPATLSSLCGVWSGISLRGQPKLMTIETITRNRQKIAWEIKAKQSWGGDSDFSSSGMSFPYTEYVTDEALPLAALQLRTTGRLSYRFDVSGDQLIGGYLTDPADRTVYTRVKR